LGVREAGARERPSGAQRCRKQGSHHLKSPPAWSGNAGGILSWNFSDHSRSDVNILRFLPCPEFCKAEINLGFAPPFDGARRLRA
jgi:hypothetical protein